MSHDDRSVAADALVQLRTRVDRHFDAAAQREGGAMRCAEGCQQCCHVRLSVFSIEADRIAAALGRLSTADPPLRARVRAQASDPNHADRCALLVEGRCSVYAERPLICRSHGLPVVVEDDGPERTDCCPLNFTTRSPAPQTPLRLVAINHPLSVMERLWATAPEGRRIELADLARAMDA